MFFEPVQKLSNTQAMLIVVVPLPLELEAVTVYFCAAEATEGVPSIVPLDSSLRPAGKTGLMLKVKPVVGLVVGTHGVIALFIVKTLILGLYEIVGATGLALTVMVICVLNVWVPSWPVTV